MILDVKTLISIIKCDININGAAVAVVLTARSFLILILLLLLGIISWIVLQHFLVAEGSNDYARTLKLASTAHHYDRIPAYIALCVKCVIDSIVSYRQEPTTVLVFFKLPT